MPPKRRKELLWAARRAQELIERNADPIDTFEGVLNRADVRALRLLKKFAMRSLVED